MRKSETQMTHLEDHGHGTALSEALHKAGVKTPKDEAIEMVDRWWQFFKPDISKTIQAFSEELRGAYPIPLLLFSSVQFNVGIRHFVQGNHPEIRRIVRKATSAKANASRIEAHGYSTKPSAISQRKWRWRTGVNKPAADIITNDTIQADPYNARVRGRIKAGITRVKVDIAPDGRATLVSKLPVGLRSILINGQSILDATTETALKWCETHEQHVKLVRLWCSLTPDPRKRLVDQLTGEIIDALVGAA